MRHYKPEFLSWIDNEISKNGYPVCPWCAEEILPDEPLIVDPYTHDALHIGCSIAEGDSDIINAEY